jgi:hypothetical protein
MRAPGSHFLPCRTVALRVLTLTCPGRGIRSWAHRDRSKTIRRHGAGCGSAGSNDSVLGRPSSKANVHAMAPQPWECCECQNARKRPQDTLEQPEPAQGQLLYPAHQAYGTVPGSSREPELLSRKPALYFRDFGHPEEAWAIQGAWTPGKAFHRTGFDRPLHRRRTLLEDARTIDRPERLRAIRREIGQCNDDLNSAGQSLSYCARMTNDSNLANRALDEQPWGVCIAPSC